MSSHIIPQASHLMGPCAGSKQLFTSFAPVLVWCRETKDDPHRRPSKVKDVCLGRYDSGDTVGVGFAGW